MHDIIAILYSPTMHAVCSSAIYSVVNNLNLFFKIHN